MTKSRLSVFLLFIFLLSMSSSCDTSDPFSIPPPDFTTVPDAYDISNIEPVELRNGVQTYIHDEGYGEFEVSPRDQVDLFLTLRTDDDEIIYSTFSSDRVNPITVTMSAAGTTQQVFDYAITMTYTAGLKIGLLGMKEGEQRTIVVPPDQAYQNLQEGHLNYKYRDNTLFYDIKISRIGPKKVQ